MAAPVPPRTRSKAAIIAILALLVVAIGVAIAVVVAVAADDESSEDGETPTVETGPVPEGDITLEVTEECNIDGAGIARIAGTVTNETDGAHSYEVPVVVSANGEELGDAEAYVPDVAPGASGEWVNTVPLGAGGPTDDLFSVECALGTVRYAR